MATFSHRPLSDVLGPRGYIRGPFGSALVRAELQDHGIPVYEQQHAITGTREFRYFIDDQKFKQLSRFQVRPNDLIVSCSGTVGSISVIQPGDPLGIISQALLILRPRTDVVLPEFLFYFLATLEGKHAITQASHGSVQVNIAPRAVVERIEMPVPSLDEQRAIVDTLGAFDHKIELNRRMSQTLESMARALFKSWFVDFDPVRAKSEGRDPGLPGHIADLFPASFEESELRELPTGWRVATLGDMATNPRRPVKPDEVDRATPYIGLEHMPRKSIALAEWGTAASVESGKTAFRSGEILFGKLRPYFHKVGVAPVDGVCSTDIVVVAPKGDAWFGLVLEIASSDEFVDYTNATSTGTKMPRTSWSEMARYAVVVPPIEIAAAFADQLRPDIQMMSSSIHATRTLTSLRDGLLPRLLADGTSGGRRSESAESPSIMWARP